MIENQKWSASLLSKVEKHFISFNSRSLWQCLKQSPFCKAIENFLWILLCLPSCHLRFESQAHHLRFYHLQSKLSWEKNKNKQKDARFAPSKNFVGETKTNPFLNNLCKWEDKSFKVSSVCCRSGVKLLKSLKSKGKRKMHLFDKKVRFDSSNSMIRRLTKLIKPRSDGLRKP